MDRQVHPANRDTVLGAAYVVLGLAFGWASAGYPIGTALAMGSGYFPLGLSGVLVLLGLVVLARGIRQRRAATALAPWDWRGLAWITGSTLAFALALAPLGLPAAIVLLVLLASRASHEFNWRTAILNGLVLATLNVAIFVWLLGLPLPLWPA